MKGQGGKTSIPSADDVASEILYERPHAPPVVGCTVVEVNANGNARVLRDDDRGVAGAMFYEVWGGPATVGDKGLCALVGEERQNMPGKRVVIIQRSGAVVGEMKPFAGASVPAGYLLCDGAAVSRTTYAALFALIGTTYGAGNGTTTFNLPDCRERFLLGAGATHALGTSAGIDEAETSAGAGVLFMQYPPFITVNLIIRH